MAVVPRNDDTPSFSLKSEELPDGMRQSVVIMHCERILPTIRTTHC